MAWLGYNVVSGECIELPEGTIQKLIGKRLTEKDDPVDIGD